MQISGKRFIKYSEDDKNVIISNAAAQEPIQTVGTKAFLSCNLVERLVLPETVDTIEDWAFAHMKNLKELTLPGGNVTFGRKVFVGCTALERILIQGSVNQYEGIPYLLAVYATVMGVQQLQTELAGDSELQWQWLKHFDEQLLRFLAAPDQEGFEPAFIGWFDVEDVDDQQEKYIYNRQLEKVELAFLRLFFPEKLEPETEAELTDYLLGKRQNCIAWRVLEQFANKDSKLQQDVRYAVTWQKIGGFEQVSPGELLAAMPEAEPEVRAYIMNLQLDESDSDDFFSDMEL